MKNRLIFLLFLSYFSSEQALEKKPWPYEPYQFHLGATLNPNFFTNVRDGYNPSHYHSTNLNALAYLLVPFNATKYFQIEVELDQTRKFDFGFESAAFQFSDNFLNDINGDLFSLSLLANVRFVANNRLHDVATPYHGIANFEAGFSLGKEFTRGNNWILRSFLYGALGLANRGYPWINVLWEIDGRGVGNIELSALAIAYLGLGHYTLIDIEHFDSYAFYRHQSIDVGGKIAYDSPIYGKLSLTFLLRAFAQTYPSDFVSLILTYDFPFSL